MQTENCCGLQTVCRLCHLLIVLFVALTTNCLAQSNDLTETIRVDSDLVDLKVSVVTTTPRNPSINLQQKDFLVLEDGAPQEILFFAAADAPFDLVLLLDLSGSTADKIKLIRRSAKRFVEATRPLDRVAIVTFSSETHVVCGLTLDRGQLKDAIDSIEKPVGGTNFWDSLHFVLERIVSSGQPGRRRAVVVMTDGVDNALPDVFGDGSKTTFEALLAQLRESDSLVFPIYLDTEKEETKRHRAPRSAYAIARDQLAMLAGVCGTTMYRADKLKDLETVYKRVIQDLATVYSIGYRPSNHVRDGRWRSVAVSLPHQQDLLVRTKRGYYAKSLVENR